MKNKKNKLHKTELCLLSMMLLCYAGCLYFFVTDNKSNTIMLFILHSCLALAYFFMLAVRYSRIPVNDHSEDAFIPSVLEDAAKELSGIKAQYDILLSENEQKDKIIADLKSKKDLSPSQTVPDSSVLRYSLLPKPEKITDIDILSIANNTAERYQKTAAAHGGVISVSSAGSELKIKACANHITILFQNITDNSMKYMKRLGSLVITLSCIGENIFIAFKDNGEALSQSELEHIFDLNYQGSNRCGGTGLGLAQAKAIVEHYHGTITAKSENGIGIYIRLPLTIEAGGHYE